MGKINNYFGIGNTARGMINFYSNIFQDVEESYILIGGSNTYKTKFLVELKDKYKVKYDVDVINSPIDNNEIEAIIIKEENIAFINGSLLHEKHIYPICSNKKFIDLDLALDKMKIDFESLSKLKVQLMTKLSFAQIKFEEGLKEHDKLEKYYIGNLDFKKADELADVFSKKFISIDKGCVGKIYDRYFGGATPNGGVDYIQSLTENLKRYFIKGRAGTGKSTLLKKIANYSKEKGYDTEVYHCGFDPNSLDMVVVRELGFAIFDSTAPHEYFPTENSDEIIDVYKLLSKIDVDNVYKSEVENIEVKYLAYKAEGSKIIKQAGEIKANIDKIFDNAFDEKVAESLLASIIPVL